MLLRLPAVYQESVHSCAEAAAKCVLTFHGITASVPAFSTLTDGADPRQVEAMLRGRPLCLNVISGEMGIEDLKWFCQSRRPVIALVHWEPDEASHFVVIRGVGRGSVFCHDPDPTIGSRRLPIIEWAAAWRASDGRMGEVFRNWGICAWPR